jgi:hypothetical protein
MAEAIATIKVKVERVDTAHRLWRALTATTREVLGDGDELVRSTLDAPAAYGAENGEDDE